MRYLITALVMTLALAASADTGRVPRDDGSVITYYLDRPQSDLYPIVVILQGSECLKVSDKYGSMIDPLVSSGHAVLRVEKPGLTQATEAGECPSEYLRLNTPQRRVLDLLLVLAELRRTPGYDGNLALTGGSEGAMIAAMTAPLLADLRALVLYSGGGGTIFGDEVLNSVRVSMLASGAPEDAIASRLHEIKEQLQQIRSEPVPSKEWLSDGKLSRNSYLWWANAWDLQLSIPLLRVEAPILAWQGQSDDSVPVLSARTLQETMRKAGKKNFELRTYAGGHGPPEEVLRESLDWVIERLASSTK